MLVPKVRVVRCTPKTHPCPKCGKRGHLERPLFRRIRSLAYRQDFWTDVHYAEYKARCKCFEYFRSWPLDVPAKSDYDDLVRAAVLDRLLEDGLDVERTLAAMWRDFGLKLSQGFVYDSLRWRIAQLDMTVHRRMVLEKFSGTLCVDELHLGRFTLLLATDPISDLPVAFALVSRNDQDHRRRFLKNLATWGLKPIVVVTDGSSLYPAVLAELWPFCRHQLCVFHVLKDIDKLILDGVRRMARAMGRRGKSGRKLERGRPSKAQQAARAAAGPTTKEKAAFVMKHRFLIVKKYSDLTAKQWDDLTQMFEYLPEMRTMWNFAVEVNEVFGPKGRVQTLYRRRAVLLGKTKYQEVPELREAMEMLEKGKFKKMVAFSYSEIGKKVRTNHHVERTNRKIRFAEKVRYKWRQRKWMLRYVLLALDHWWRQAAEAAKRAKEQPPQPQTRAS